MAKELNEDTGFNVSIKTLLAIGFAMATISGLLYKQILLRQKSYHYHLHKMLLGWSLT